MSQSNPTDQAEIAVEAELYWAMVPEWVIYAPISSNAVRLYAVLARHADKDTKRCHPTRHTIAKLMHASRATVDRAMDELRELGAVKVIRRKSKSGDWTSNVYIVKSIPPAGVSSPVSRPLITDDETGAITGDEQTRVSNNQSHERRVSIKSNAGVEVAKAWYEAQDPKPIGKRAFWAVRTLCIDAVSAGHSPEHVRTTLDRLGYIPSSTIFDRELRNPRPESFSERKAREGREHADKAAAMRRALEEEDRQRQERIEREKADAVPMTDEARERLEALGILRKRSA